MKKVLLCAFFLTTIFSHAQFTEILSSDKPGQALSGSVVGKNVFQIQAGIDYFESVSDFFPSSYFRYGLSEKIELNSNFLFSGENFGKELASFTLGARFRLNNIESNIQSSLQISYDFKNQGSNTQIIYILADSFSEKLAYNINIGLNLEDGFSLNNGIYVFNLSYAINDKIGVFLEPFGTFLRSTFQFNIDSGVYYLLNNNLQLDTLIGENNGLFVGAGVTWRLPSKK
ncbi:MAG: transporter [Polaribacter sp.]